MMRTNMQPFNVKVHDYAEKLIETPRAHLRLTLWQHENGLELFHEDNLMIECFLTPSGMLAGGFLAQSLGIKIPPLGEKTLARVSTGVLFRSISIVQLNYDVPESQVLLDRLLSEAEAQRGGSSDAT